MSEESGLKIHHLLACFDSSRGDGTLSGLFNERIYDVVEKPPQFQGGINGMLMFIKKNMRYPAIARQHAMQGTVYVEFLVHKDGSITDVKTKKSAGPAFDAEAERVIKLMPPWVPGLEKGRPVTVRFVLPISFKTN